jgi:hypothetical protein
MMPEIEKQKPLPTRVTYQGITYTICRSCHEVIGSGKNEATLLAVEDFHNCAAMKEETEDDYAMRAYSAKAGA